LDKHPIKLHRTEHWIHALILIFQPKPSCAFMAAAGFSIAAPSRGGGPGTSAASAFSPGLLALDGALGRVRRRNNAVILLTQQPHIAIAGCESRPDKTSRNR